MQVNRIMRPPHGRTAEKQKDTHQLQHDYKTNLKNFVNETGGEKDFEATQKNLDNMKITWNGISIPDDYVWFYSQRLTRFGSI